MVTTRGATRSKGSLIHMKNTKVKCEKQIEQIMKKKIRKYSSGRPKKQILQLTPQTQGEIQIDYICKSPGLIRIMEHISTQAQYKLLSKTRQNDKEFNDQIQKLNQVVNTHMKKNNIGKDFVFFLRSGQCRRDFEFRDGKLIDHTQYWQCELSSPLKQDSDVQNFLKLINLIFKELTPEFIIIFQNIVQFYLEVKIKFPFRNTTLIVEQLLEYINKNKQNEMKYLLFWNELKTLTKDTYITCALLKLQQRENNLVEKTTKIKQKPCSEKIKAKQIPFINMQSEWLNQQKLQTPIQYFISELVYGFEQLWDELPRVNSQEQCYECNCYEI